ncbi:MAG: hypothetical protein U5K69_01045 [Balneolaceae bacterium]|nr:hypothetical protein [Balneolaceae bacterium]
MTRKIYKTQNLEYYVFEEKKDNNQEEEKQLTCPECAKGFQDLRGLTSHARHKHEMDKNEILKAINKKNNDSISWKILGGIGTFILAIITVGKTK